MLQERVLAKIFIALISTWLLEFGLSFEGACVLDLHLVPHLDDLAGINLLLLNFLHLVAGGEVVGELCLGSEFQLPGLGLVRLLALPLVRGLLLLALLRPW